MVPVILVTGGCRSGKSAFALEYVEARTAPSARTFIATSQAWDEEMRERIGRHQEERQGRGWQTVEEPVDLALALSTVPPMHGILVDCLSLWATNLLLADQEGISEDNVKVLTEKVIAACRQRHGPVVFVTNEVGLGIVPENALARRFRDILGRINQTAAALADEVYLLVSGIPVRLR